MIKAIGEAIEYVVFFILVRAAIKDLKTQYVPLDVVYKLLFVLPVYIVIQIFSRGIKNITENIFYSAVTFGFIFIISLLGGLLFSLTLKSEENKTNECELYDLGEIYKQKYNFSIDISIWAIIISFILFLVLEKIFSACIIIISFAFELLLTLIFEKYDDTIDFYVNENKNALLPIKTTHWGFIPAIGGGDILILSYLAFLLKKDILNLFVLAVFVQFVLLLIFKRRYGREVPFIPAIMIAYLLVVGHVIPFDFWRVIELWKEMI